MSFEWSPFPRQKDWEFPNLVVSNVVVNRCLQYFTRKRSFVLFCALLRTRGYALLRSFARILLVSASDRVENDRVWELRDFGEF